ncbi:unnamed protein product, partial [Ascophyllum nodosum]
ACCCTAAVVHPHDPMTKGRGGCRECQSPVHCSTPLLPDVDTFRGTGRCRISQLYRYVCTVRPYRRSFLVPMSISSSLLYPLSPKLTLLEERVGVESVSFTGTCVKEAISCSHVQPHILLFLI